MKPNTAFYTIFVSYILSTILAYFVTTNLRERNTILVDQLREEARIVRMRDAEITVLKDLGPHQINYNEKH